MKLIPAIKDYFKKEERSIKDQLRGHRYLTTPPELWNEKDEYLNDICNGCGAAGALDIVPDTMYLLNIKAACIVHDYEYSEGETLADKKQADHNFLDNLMLIIEGDIYAWMVSKWARNQRAMKYYSAVRSFGIKPFWAGKESEITNVLLNIVAKKNGNITVLELNMVSKAFLGITLHELQKDGHQPYLEKLFTNLYVATDDRRKIILTTLGRNRVNANQFNLDEHRAKG